MPAPLHVQLAPRQRRRLMELRRDPDLASRERDRVEMYLLSADGMTVPALARHFDRCEATMRRRSASSRKRASRPCATSSWGRGRTMPAARRCGGP